MSNVSPITTAQTPVLTIPIDKKVAALKKYIQRLVSLGYLSSVSGWDEYVNLPKDAHIGRGWVKGNVAELAHELSTSDELGALIQDLNTEAVLSTLSLRDRKMVEEAARSYEKSKKLPSDFVGEFGRVTVEANRIWENAKNEKDFTKFAPYLTKIVALSRQQADLYGYTGSRYNALLDLYERGMTAEQLEQIFSGLKAELVPMISKIVDSGRKPSLDLSKCSFAPSKQLKFARGLATMLGYNFDNGRLDLSSHPFTVPMGPGEARITTRIKRNDPFNCIGSTNHEAGHGIHFQNIPKELIEVGLGDSPSLGISESQSRFYENLIGKSRPFWEINYPKLQKLFPKQLGNVSLDDFYFLMNEVKPSFIRTKADELTYQLHIILRKEIEQALIEGSLEALDVRDAWNKKMNDSLGIIPSHDSEGVLQDVHWSMGGIGYFPTYSLGNLYASQFCNEMEKDLRDIDTIIRSGNLEPIKEWLGEKIHRHGSMYTADEISNRVTGESSNPRHFLDYAREKFGDLYGVSL